MLPFFCPGKRKVTERKPARPRYAKFAMQLLRLGSGEKNLHTFFLNDQKVKPHVHFLLNGQKKVNRKPALRQSRREKPSALLYRPIIKPQHLWLDCYFFFVSSNKEKVTKKACPERGQGKTYLTFFLSDEKESKQRKNRRHRFIGQFFLYTNGVNLNTLFLPCLFTTWLFHHHILC